jgi:asparagine synthase (glutamine-hydrolysing)
MRANMGTAKMNYWLRSANKANFGIPIEPRAPFLDYRVVDFAFTLPFEFLIRDGWHKWVLRKAMSPLLPAQVLWRRRKMGFPFPITSWLISSKPQVQAALLDTACPYLAQRGLLQRYEEFARLAPYTLWRLVCIGLWWRRVVEGLPIAADRAG